MVDHDESPEQRIARWIRNMRKAAGLHQADFARALTEAAGRTVSQQTVSDWERGASHPSASDLLTIAQVVRAGREQWASLIGENDGSSDPAFYARMFIEEWERHAGTAEKR